MAAGDFDPRYDRAYQPGFDGELTVSPPRRRPLTAGWVVAAILLVIGAAGMLVPPAPIPITVVDYLLPLVADAISPWVLAAGATLFLGALVVRSARR